MDPAQCPVGLDQRVANLIASVAKLATERGEDIGGGQFGSLTGAIPPPVAAAIDALRPAWERVRAAASPSPSTLRRG